MGRKRAGAWAQRAKIKSDHTGCHPNKIRGNYNVANPILINKVGSSGSRIVIKVVNGYSKII